METELDDNAKERLLRAWNVGFTLNEVAARFHVGYGTVNRILNDLERSGREVRRRNFRHRERKVDGGE